MKLVDEIIENAMKKFGITRKQAEDRLQAMIEDGLVQQSDDPSMPFDLKLTLHGIRYTENLINKEYGEFKKITNHNGISYKVPTIVIMREGIREQDLSNFPLWDNN